MISIDMRDLYVIYSKGSECISLTYDEVFVRKEDAEQNAESCRETSREIENKFLPENSNLRTKFYVSTLDEFISEYGEYKIWE